MLVRNFIFWLSTKRSVTNSIARRGMKLGFARRFVAGETLAEALTASLGKPMTSENVRKTLQRAHERFADLLVEQVADSLAGTSPTEIKLELQTLDLLRYCRSALARRRPAG